MNSSAIPPNPDTDPAALYLAAATVVKATVDTLRTISRWGPMDPEEFAELAERIEEWPPFQPGDWTLCPICQEVNECDGSCPMEPVRRWAEVRDRDKD